MVRNSEHAADPKRVQGDGAANKTRRALGEAQVVLINAADIEPVSINWLWPNWLQRGAFNLLAGQSTAGKSTIALSFSATVASGGGWPDGQSAGEPARVVFWSGEDGVKDTLLPRFLAAGGERSNMHFIGGVRDGERKRPFDPAADMPKLMQAVRRLKDVRLIVLDPIATAVTGDSHKNVETRVGLQPFADLCAQTGACGLGVHHFTKNTAAGHPLDRVSGSLAPRCVLVAAKDQTGGRNARRALMRAKVSNGPDWGGFDYKLDQRPLDDWPQIEAQRVLWGDVIDGSARDILAQFESKPVGVRQRQAVLFLTAALAGGPRLAAEVIAEAAKAGISERALRYTFKSLGGTPERHGKGHGHFVLWELPKEPLAPVAGVTGVAATPATPAIPAIPVKAVHVRTRTREAQQGPRWRGPFRVVHSCPQSGGPSGRRHTIHEGDDRLFRVRVIPGSGSSAFMASASRP
jgi:putative DNA primase/helicase